MTPTVVVDLDKVLLAGDASTLFLSGRLRQAPWRALLLLAAAPLLVPGAMLPWTRPLAARLLTRLAVGGATATDVESVADAYRAVLARRPEAAVADAIGSVRAHRAAGDLVVVATGCEQTLARGFLTAIGLGDVDVVGSTGSLRPLRVRRAMGGTKVEMLTERGHPPPWAAVYSDSPSDLPLFAGMPRPVLVNADERAATRVTRVLGRRPETVTWR
ncbi:haloacid dehalogenase-like hydrolase [Geodermatophilus sabuli]|uniref:Haloacid dehalogenase-like hydrolase n=1 Tax=Geodermatophilus sabuli TaxID=1564158 RepID=A0A7K3W337_9ACTN|nr:HAD family hydrolase [Geodermatophilus sabuli]NEK59285.1 haloacid dehalogenase-like hydrolase [Geodermatophilus sabuli]